MTTPPAPFEAPWHAQAFALAVALNEAGHFTWADWTERFGQQLELARKNGPLTGGDDYYTAWIACLEAILAENDTAAAKALAAWKAAWTDAYLATPHGQSVHPIPPSTG